MCPLCPFSSYSCYIFHCKSILQIYYSVSTSLSIAPPGINPLEHEELPMSVQQVQQNVRPPLVAAPQMSTERHHGTFSEITALPLSFAIKPNGTVSLYRARMDNRDVILRVLKGKVSCTEPNIKLRGPTAYCTSAEEVQRNVLLSSQLGDTRNGLITGLQTLEFYILCAWFCLISELQQFQGHQMEELFSDFSYSKTIND